MAGKVLSIEITTHFIRGIEVDYLSKKPKVYKNFVIPTPTGAYTDGTVMVNEELVKSIGNAINENKITTKKVVFNSLSSRIATREVTIPPIKEKKIADFVRANAAEYFPVDVSTYEVSYVFLEDVVDGKIKKKRLQVYAVPEDIITAYRNLANKLKLKLAAFDYTGNSMYQMAKNYYKDGVQVFAKIENTSSQVLIISDGEMVLQRTVPYGVKEIFNVLINSELLPTVEDSKSAMDYFARNDVIYDEDHIMNLSVAEMDKIDDSLKELASGISRVIDYYANNNKDKEINKIYILGLGSYIKGIDKLLEYELTRPVKCLSNISGININNRKEKSKGAQQFIACIGSAIEPVILSENLKDGEISEDESLRSTKTVFKIMIIVALLLVLISGGLNVYTMVNIGALNSDLEDLAEAQEVYSNYLDASTKHAEISVVEESMYTVNKQLVAMFEEMEEKLPATVRISSLSTQDSNLTLSLTVLGKDGAAKTLVQLRSMNTIDSVQTMGVTNVDERGDVEMTVTAVMVETE